MSQGLEMNMNEKMTTEVSHEPGTYGTFDASKPVTSKTTTEPGLLERTKEKVMGAFSSNKDAKDSEITDENKPGVLQGAKEMMWQGVEKAKGVFSTKPTEPTELYPGNGYRWKRTTGEQGQVHWVATGDWSGDSANRGGFLEGAKGMWRSGVEKAKGVFSSNKDSEVTENKQEIVTEEEQKPSALQGAKEKVWQGVEKAKGMFTSTKPMEQHPGNGYSWKKVQGEQGRFRWVATDDWSTDKPGVFQGAKEKVLQGVAKTKEVFSSSKSTDIHDQHPGKGYKWKKVEGQQGDTHWKTRSGFQSLTGTH